MNGVAITYDAIGNPLNDGTWTYTWQNGRQLARMQSVDVDASFVYNENGLRVQKTVNGVVTKYILHGKDIKHMTKGSDELHFFYDTQNKPAVVVFNGTPYSYVKNLQGDIVAILDSSKNVVVGYVYDAWGVPSAAPAPWQTRWVRSTRSATVAMSTMKRRGCTISEAVTTGMAGVGLLAPIKYWDRQNFFPIICSHIVGTSQYLDVTNWVIAICLPQLLWNGLAMHVTEHMMLPTCFLLIGFLTIYSRWLTKNGCTLTLTLVLANVNT